jgi:hypothetical protein
MVLEIELCMDKKGAVLERKEKKGLTTCFNGFGPKNGHPW